MLVGVVCGKKVRKERLGNVTTERGMMHNSLNNSVDASDRMK